MNEQRDDDEPAFPGEKVEYNDFDVARAELKPGMSLRDYFAAHANERDISFYRFPHGDEFAPECTREAAKYRHADEMLVARERKK